MKTVGIIGAMEEEIGFLKQNMDMISAKNIVGMDFFMGKLCGKNAVAVRSGIGKVNAAVCTQVLCDLYGVDAVINTGLAGACDPELDILDIVISSDTLQHDFDTAAFGYEPGFIPRMAVGSFQADETLIALAAQACAKTAPERKALVGRVASGDCFVSCKDDIERIRRQFNAACVEMEGGAIGHVCYLNKIPFVVVRTISDKAGDNAGNEFNNALADAAKQSCEVAEAILRLI